ncbi:MAG: hypothetical protein VX872_08510, partial [Candidatus Thermoplasmatota archaeon]|nr:hypothetical protein [Candidatus Thermoplasmatota archaeon]
MEDNTTEHRMMPLVFVGLLLMSFTSVVHAEEAPNEFIIDGRLQMVMLEAGETYQQTINVEEGAIVSVNVGCSSCQVQLDAEDTSISSSTSVAYEATEATSVQITISSSTAETVFTSVLVAEDEMYLNQRPSPDSTIDLVDSYRCEDPSACLDMHRGNLRTILNGNYASLGFDAGAVKSDAEEYYGFEVYADQTVELTLHHASDSIRFDFYMQTETGEQLFDAVIETMTATNPNTLEDTIYLDVAEDGRIIVKTSTSAPFSAYALQRTIHDAQLTMTVDEGISQFTQVGHGLSKSAFAIDPTGVIKLSPVIEDITASVSLRIGDAWVAMPEVLVEQNTVERIYVYPNTTMAMLNIENSVHWVDVALESTADGNTTYDAPAYRPSSLDQTNWPILYAENTDDYTGELTLATMDTSDVYLISVDGWVDSEHRLNIVIDGNSPDLRGVVQELNQETMEVLSEHELSPDLFTYDMDLYITLGPGLHFIEFHHVNDSILQDQNWGNNLQALEYSIEITKVTTEIGEEPWFAPSDEAKFWGTTVRWILGLGMMLPAIYLVYAMRKTRRNAARIGAMKQRLAMLTSLLDEGTESPEQTRKSLVRSLEAVATLPWESAIDSWGEPQRSYTTDGTSIAVWNLDSRLA